MSYLREASFPEHYPMSKSGRLRPQYVTYLRKRLVEDGKIWNTRVLRYMFGYHLERQINDGATRQDCKANLRAAFDLHRIMSNVPAQESEQFWRDVLVELNAKLKLEVTGIMHMGGDERVTCEDFLRQWDKWTDKYRWDRKMMVLFQCVGSIRWR